MRDLHGQPSLALGPPRREVLPWPAERTVLFASGREALVAMCRAVAPPRRPVALVPAYLPEGVRAPFLTCGWTVCLYPVDRELDPDWSALERMLDDARGGAAVLIHTFGLTKDSARFAGLCRARDVLAIDDLGHVVPDAEVRVHGDLALYSLPKVLGVPDGAALVLRDPSFALSSLAFRPHPMRTLVTARRLAMLLAVSASRSRGALGMGRAVRGAASALFDPYDLHMRQIAHPGPMSGLSRALLSRTDIGSQVRRRRAIARRYDEGLDRAAFVRFGERLGLWAGIGFPVRVRDRKSLTAHMRGEGVQLAWFESHWDFIPDGERDHHPGAISAMREHVLFPTSPALRDADVERIIAAANRWAPGPPGSGTE